MNIFWYANAVDFVFIQPPQDEQVEQHLCERISSCVLESIRTP